MNADAIQEFLFRHVEKFIFGGLIILAMFLVYQGMNKPDISKTYKPETLEVDAKRVRNSIEDDHWAAPVFEPRRVTIDIVGRTNKTITPVDPSVYRLPHPWEAKSIDSSLKRTDPKISAPIELQVVGVIASLAVKATDYPLKALEPADAAKKIEKKVIKKKEKLSPGDLAQAAMAESMKNMNMGPPAGSFPGMPGFDGSIPGGAAAMPVIKPVRPLDGKLYDQGYRPGTAMNTVAPVMGQFIAGVALMPQKEICKNFETALAQADGYMPLRDQQPYYVGLQLQRADVTDKPVDKLTDADWANRANSIYYQRLLLSSWSGMAKEIVDAKYRDPQLTTAIPPVMLDNYSWFASHPKIPLGDEPLPGMAGAARPKPVAAVAPIIPDSDDPSAFNGIPRRNNGMIPMGMPPGGMPPGFNPSMMMGPFGPGMAKIDQPNFKLIRFYDFAGLDPNGPKPGRKYVYRIKIAIEDPNFPADLAMQPRNSTLSAEVFKRVAKLTAEAAEQLKKNPTKAIRNSTLWSEFSAPSPAVSLPSLNEAFLGPVEPGSTKVYEFESTQIEFHAKPPKGKLVVTHWDAAYGVRVPVFMDVTKGSVVAKTGTFEVPDPVAMEVKKLPETTINTGNVVLDLSGGKPLAIAPAENQTEPGMVLLFDPDGGLKVVDEVETQRSYRLYSFADERDEG